MTTSMRIECDEALEAEIARLDGLGFQELREIWRQRLGPPPEIASTDLTRRWLAYELQVQAYGGLRSETRRRLKQLYKAFKTNPTYTPTRNLGLKPGLVLTREWNGARHQVIVLEKGFAYGGENFRSLSEVARRITGSHWSGPLFFGLRGKAESRK